MAALGPLALAALTVGDIGTASAEDAEAGGPGYFYSVPALRRIANFDDSNWNAYIAGDPLLQAYLANVTTAIAP